MKKLWDTLKNKAKTIHELTKEFPHKTYKELEKYRDADRNEEAQRIFTQQENEELKENQIKETWKDKYDLEHRLRQEAQAGTDYLQDELDRVKRENNDLHNKVAALLDSDAALPKVRESGL